MSEERIIISMNVLKDCLGLCSGELLAVVADDDKRELAESVYEAGKDSGGVGAADHAGTEQVR